MPFIAAHDERATTATPSENSTTCSTPFTRRVSVSSKPLSLPPKTGQRRTVANFMPGTRKSNPNTAVPSTFEGMSSRGMEVSM